MASEGRVTLLVRPLSTSALVALLVACVAPPSTNEEKVTRLTEMIDDISAQFPDVRVLTVDEAGRLLEKDSLVLIDVRDAHERAVSTIPGSITAEQYEADPDRYADIAAVAYCTIGHRSSQYAERLEAEGHEVFNLAGSILAWTHAGGPLVGEDGPTTRLHVYGERWNLASDRYETVW